MKITDRAAEGYSASAVLLLEQAADSNERHDYAEAEGIYSLVIADYPAPSFAYAKRGYARAKLGKHTLAIEDFNAAITRKPDSPVTVWQRALTYEYLGELDSAVDDYLLFLKLKGDDDEAYTAIGMICEYRGDSKRAIDFYREATRVCPDNREARFRIEELTQRAKPPVADGTEGMAVKS